MIVTETMSSHVYVGCRELGPARPAAAPSPTPSWRLCPTEGPSLALGVLPSLTTTKHRCAISTAWAVSLPDFYKPSLSRGEYPPLHNHALFMSLLFASMYMCEQLFSRMRHRESKMSSKISDKHLESSVRVATTAISEALVSQKQGYVSH